MTRSISANILEQLESEELRPFYLLSMDIDGTVYYYTDCDIPITLTYTYNPIGFKFQPIRYSINEIVDQATIEIDNIDSVMTSLFVGGTPQSGAAVLSLVVLDSVYSVVDNTSVTVFEGEIDSWTLDESKLKITITSIFHQWSQHTMAQHSPSCRWRIFNSSALGTSGIECRSTAGSTWCDRTYERCKTLNNSSHFGGFRFLPDIVDKEIWWGRIQSE
jgi:hypothetical protein